MQEQNPKESILLFVLIKAKTDNTGEFACIFEINFAQGERFRHCKKLKIIENKNSS